MKVGYFVRMYPRLSETFILNEILELERQGVEVVVFSQMKPDDGRFHPQVSRVKAPVFYLDGSQHKDWRALHQGWSNLTARRQQVWELLEELIPEGNHRYIEQFFSAAAAAALAMEMELDHLHAHFAHTPSNVAYFASTPCVRGL